MTATQDAVGLPTFDVCGPLPSGLTLLEASAGTGKTWTIAALVTRYVAEGVPVDALLVVTFTRAATGELRDRVRQRLVVTESGLRSALAGGGRSEDPVVALLATGSAAEVEDRRRRLATAVADFDAATIATTHGFCEHILAGLGTAGDVERDITFVADSRDLVDEVVDDLYVRKFVRTADPPFSLADARAIGRAVIDNPEAPIEPVSAPDAPGAEMRARLAAAVRHEVQDRKLRHATLGYDDLLTRLAATLRSPQGPVAAARLRQRYRVALVDEFQDTDPIQWEILRRAFGEDGATLVLIGDPKQAIYSFRGADVWAYLDAARVATHAATLATNWRSDRTLIDGLDALLGGATLGHPEIVYRPVRAAGADRPRLHGAPDPAALRARILLRTDDRVARSSRGGVLKGPARQVIAADLAADVVRLLSSGASLAGGEGTDERVGPGHLAVLVQTNAEAETVRDALDEVGVPAVIHGAGSVFATPVAAQWLQLLEALERPASTTRARAAALTPFVGWSAEELASADDDAIADLQSQLHRWAAVLAADGVAALQELVTTSGDLPARMLCRPGGERRLTDLRHVGQLLHAEAAGAALGTTALTGWLRQRIALAADDGTVEDRTRRLDTDADAVQVITVHRSKGLEFPIVYLPYLWATGHRRNKDVPVYHDPDAADRRTIDVGGPEGPGHGRHAGLSADEEQGEALRKTYVALTRARHQVVVWWAGSDDSAHSALARLLLRRPDGRMLPKPTRAPTDDVVRDRWSELSARAPGCISVTDVVAGDTGRWQGDAEAQPGLAIRRWDRDLDTEWRRLSYTAVTAGAHAGPVPGASVRSEPEADGLADEALPDDGLDAGGATVPASAPAALPGDGAGPVGDLPSPMGDIPGGAALGTLVHAALEETDFAAPDLEAAVTAAVAEAVRTHAGVPGLDPGTLATALATVVRTPLGPLAGGLRLRDVPRRDRLDELAFELPLVGGDVPAAELTLGGVASTVATWLPADDPLATYPERLTDPGLVPRWRGYLNGSIDLVFRIPGKTGDRYVIVDYKTNRLGHRDRPLTVADYRPAAMADAMQAAHYPLQALLYSVALHRYLRWRLPGYRPDVHLGGVLYLFVRGMAGPETPGVDGVPCGAFAWTPPAGMIAELSDLFDRGTTT